MRIDLISLFPEFAEAFFSHSIIKRAREAGLLELAVTNPRDFARNKHRQVDDTVYGGGAGMLMMCAPLFDAVRHVLPKPDKRTRVILLSPTGRTFTQEKAKQLYHDYDRLILICGHYEGVDYRVETGLADESLSVGDYVLTGGELGAMIVTDAVARMIPGVLGDGGSASGDSFYDGLLEYPQYTRPVSYEGMEVPPVLLSGHHAEIGRWRRKESLRRTREVRPDLLEKASLSLSDKKMLQDIEAERGEC